jgi:3-hydroxyisobutyrate dehydrogenase-like beta-hydroxyacid dehydrogenase
MAPGTIGIESSTVTPDHAAILHMAAAKWRLPFLDAPVAGSRPQVAAGQLVVMAGGDESTLAAAEPVLRTFAAAVHHAGGPGAGAMAKLVINTMFGVQLAALAEALGLAAAGGYDAARMAAIWGETPVASPAARVAASAMLAGAFAPAFPIDLVTKDFALIAGAASAAGADMPVAAAAGAAYRAAGDAGLADQNITAIAARYLRQPVGTPPLRR